MTNSKPIIVIATVGLNSIGGIEAYVRNMAQGFLARGWQVHCIATNSRGDAFGKLGDGISCHDLSSLPLNPKKVFTVAKLVNRINPDILLLNNCALLHYALPLLNSSIIPIAVLHSDDPYFYNIASLFAHRIHRWVAPATGLAKEFRKHLRVEYSDAVCVIPHGVSEQYFRPLESVAKGGTCYRIAFVGFVAENKGADLLPEIMRRVVQSYPSIHLTVVGYGPLYEQLEQQFLEAGIEKNATFTGPLSPEGVVGILSNSDIFLLPTRIEGFGLVIAEAMMSGAVPVVSRLAGITDTIVTHNETGMLVEVDDVEGLSAAIVDLLSNSDRLALMKLAAQKTAREKFTLQRMIDVYERLFGSENERSIMPSFGIAGWVYETVREMTRKDSSGNYRLQKKLSTVKRMLASIAGKVNVGDRDASSRAPEREMTVRMNESTKEDEESSMATVVIVDKSPVLAGAEWNLCILAEHLNKAKFRVVIAADYPHSHHAVYLKYGAEVLHRNTSLKWWMGSERWRRPLRGTDAIKRMIFARQLRHIIAGSDAKILHVSLLKNDSWIDLAAARSMGLKTVGSVNSLLSQRHLDKRCLELCDMLICGSDFVAREIGGQTESSRITRIYSPISVAATISLEERNIAKRELGMNPDTFVISSVAMLDPRKGHDVAIQAFAKLSEEFSAATLLIVGGVYAESGNAELERLQKLAFDSGVSSRVVFSGYISELRKVYVASDIVLALSKDGEAFGRVTAEAAAHGRVAIATAVGATPELIQDGITGFLVHPNDPEAVAERCRRVLVDKDLALQIGVAAMEQVARNFHPDMIARQTEAVYERLLKP